jgi:hypothetical protein
MASRRQHLGVAIDWNGDRSSAEVAVDRDLRQRALEDGELLVIESFDEQLGDAADVCRHSLLQAAQPGIGQPDDDATSVGVGAGSLDQALIDHPGDPSGHTGP